MCTKEKCYVILKETMLNCLVTREIQIRLEIHLKGIRWGQQESQLLERKEIHKAILLCRRKVKIVVLDSNIRRNRLDRSKICVVRINSDLPEIRQVKNITRISEVHHLIFHLEKRSAPDTQPVIETVIRIVSINMTAQVTSKELSKIPPVVNLRDTIHQEVKITAISLVSNQTPTGTTHPEQEHIRPITIQIITEIREDID